MKKMFGMIGMLAAVVLMCGSASAAGVAGTTVQVPFSFIVGNTELPAGEYVVKELANAAEVIALESTDGREYATTLTIPGEEDDAATAPELGFEKFEEHYFLARITSPEGADREIVLTPEAMQKEIVAAAMNELTSVGERVPIN
jgi:hypothetical protein